MKDLQKKIERLEKDNKEMLRNLKEDYNDFKLIQQYLKFFKERGCNIDLSRIKNDCKLAMSAIKKYTRRRA